MISIRKSFSAKLTIAILLLAAPIFVIALGVLYTQSRHMIRNEAVGRANTVLSTTMQRVSLNLITIETATNTDSWLVLQNLHPDSLLQLTRRIVYLNPHVDGCSISLEPDVFPDYGKYFSVYSVRQNDSVASVIEEQYEYFQKIWYKQPRDLGKSCWVAFYDEADTLELSLEGLVASYSKPIYRADHSLVGVMSTDLSLIHLSKVISQEEPYPHSYFMLIDEDGRYFTHPDSTLLFTHTIYDGVDPHKQADIVALGHEMTAGNKGSMSVNIDGADCLVCYAPVPGTTWSLALVCPVSDILEGYHRQTYVLLPLLLIGLLAILLVCHRVVKRAINPLNQLLEKTQSIASGNMEVYIPRSQREDSVGCLQNSFASMLQALNFHLGSVHYTTQQAEHRNEQLLEATRLAQESERQKTAFIQNVSHQIRTPLNILMGFAQVISDTSHSSLSDDDMQSITATMDYNSKLLNRIVKMLFDSSDTGLSVELNSHKHDKVVCLDIARETIDYVKEQYPNMTVHLSSDLPDDFCIQTSQLYLMRSLRELLYNAGKYSDGKDVNFQITRTDTMVRFIVEDTGKGIAEADRERLFKFFAKVDDLSEGLGLGLPLAKRHAQNLGGDIILDTDYHDGCRFIVEIPLS